MNSQNKSHAFFVSSLKNCGWLWLPYLLMSFLEGIALAFFTNFISALPHHPFSFSNVDFKFIFMLSVFIIAPIVSLMLNLLMILKTSQMLTTLCKQKTYLEAPSVIGRCISSLQQSYILPIVFLQIPLMLVVYILFTYQNEYSLAPVFYSAIFPLVVAIIIGKKKITHAHQLFDHQNERALKIKQWHNHNGNAPLSKNLFDDELHVRKREFFLDEIENILPSLLVVVGIIILWGGGFCPPRWRYPLLHGDRILYHKDYGTL